MSCDDNWRPRDDKFIASSVEESVAQLGIDCESSEIKILTYNNDENSGLTNKSKVIFYIIGSLVIIILLAFIVKRLLSFHKIQNALK